MTHLVLVDLEVETALKVVFLVVAEEVVESVLMHFASIVALVQVAGQFYLVQVAVIVLFSQVVSHDVASEQTLRNLVLVILQTHFS